MTGIGFIIFGIFVALFGYTLITCTLKERHSSTNRAVAEITEIKPLSTQEPSLELFQVIVKYVINQEQVISTFTTQSPANYEAGKRIEILFNPNKPSQILSLHENSTISPLFIIITSVGILSFFLGILLTLFKI